MLDTPFNDARANASEWAAMYRALGLQVIPAHGPSDGDKWKRPFGSWLEFQDTLAPDAVFKRWFDPQAGEHRANLNMGLITGAASGGLLVIDLDRKDGSKAFEWWAGLIAVHNANLEPETWKAISGGGGGHMMFRAPPGYVPPTFKAPSMGVDVRGQGGFVMCAPSLHASGNSYSWWPGNEPWACDLMVAPGWVTDAVEDLRMAHGGAVLAQERTSNRTRTEQPSGQVVDQWGRDIDGREQKILAAVWAAVVDLYRECPIPPPQALQEAEVARLFEQYERTTRSRLAPVQGASNADLLEAEGRGVSEFWRKWNYAMRHWHTKVAEAAREPRPFVEAAREHAAMNGFASIADDFPTQQASPLSSTSESNGPKAADTLHGQAPQQGWVIPEWLVEGEVNSLYGMGGLGKSTLAQQLAYAAATGETWLGLPVNKRSSLAVFCEDNWGVLHRRHDAIRRGAGQVIGNPYSDVYLWPRFGHESVLLGFTSDRPAHGLFYQQLQQEIDRLNPGLLILDNISNVFAGNEIDRAQVTYFLSVTLNALIQQQVAKDRSLTILLLGHPSISGGQTQGFSGSTAWENGVRSRLYLSKPEGASNDERTLSRRKSNYAASGDETAIKLLWTQGAFTSLDSHTIKQAVRAHGLVQRVTDQVAFAWARKLPYMERAGHDRNLHARLTEEFCHGEIRRDMVLEAISEAIEDGLIYPSANRAKRGWRPSGGD